MKKLFAILLAAMMVFALAACDTGDDPNPSGSNNPGTSQNGGENNNSGENNNGETNGNGSNDVTVSTEWYTKPFHIKGTVYDDNEPDGEMEIIYDGEGLLIWNGEDGEYAYMDGDTLMEKRFEREEDVIDLTYEGTSRSTSILDFMENQADFLGGIIFYIEYLSDYKQVGTETVEGFDCVKYQSDEDVLGNTYEFWIDKATGVFVKEQTIMTLDVVMGTKLETPETEINYVVNYISVNNVPSISSVYDLPTE